MDAARIEGNLHEYLGKRRPSARYTSFDYCFNYFRSHKDAGRLVSLSDESLELSCLHLGFYLASWGMLRGSSPLLGRSVRHYIHVVEAIVGAPPDIWDVDAHAYDESSIDLILDVRGSLRSSFNDPSSDILITKVMLGVFGCVPAFDTQFKRGFDVWTFGRGSLKRIGEFYSEHAQIIDRHREHTIDFRSGGRTQWRYTRAKVIDMIFFIEGAPKRS